MTQKKVTHKREHFISFRVTLEEYIEISKMASKMEDGSISKYIRKLLKTGIK